MGGRLRFFLAGVLLSAVVADRAFAQSSTEHQLVRRLVVFPVEVESQYQDIANSIWWDLRKKLTDNKRFLVASKNFMDSKEVFHPRGELAPADAIILGRLLDAHGLVTVALKERNLTLRAFEGRQGYRLWEKSLELHPSLPLSKQLPKASEQLLLDFLASFPYQGFVVTDQIIGQTMYREAGQWRFKADIGVGLQVNVGDKVQVVRVASKSLEPLFLSGAEVKAQGEGRVVGVDRNIITVELDRVVDPAQITAGSLVQLPDELKRLQQTYSMGAPSVDVDSSSLPFRKGLTEEEEKTKPLVTSLSWVANLAIMLIIAL